VFHSFPDSGNDVQRGVGNMIRWIKERDTKVRFGLIENKSGEAIVDFLLSPGASDDVKALRKRPIDAMAKFDMSEVKAWYAHGK
jgi:hypothetical protein